VSGRNQHAIFDTGFQRAGDGARHRIRRDLDSPAPGLELRVLNAMGFVTARILAFEDSQLLLELSADAKGGSVSERNVRTPSKWTDKNGMECIESVNAFISVAVIGHYTKSPVPPPTEFRVIEPDVRIAFPPLVNDRDSVKFIADVAETIVGKENMNREGPYVMASEDFSYMLEKVPGAFINIGNGGGEGGCEVHNPSYDFNDDIITLGATLWSRVVEKKLSKDAR